MMFMRQVLCYNGSMERTILHCDCNAYFASVELLDRPELKNVPMAVSGDPQSRHGIILAKNELAKHYGVATAETVWQAKKKCPTLVLVPPHREKYDYYCKKINQIYQEYTDRVEAFSVDESWLDVTGCLHAFKGGGEQLANLLRQRVRKETGITISVGVSFNKVFAKLGSDYKKPDATTVITRENYQSLLWPLPARNMLFVGKSASSTLESAGILTIGDIALAGRARMLALLGRSGETVWTYACGLDESPVRLSGDVEPVKSVGNSITFSRDLTGEKDIRTGLTMLCDQVASRLRRHGFFCTSVQVQIKDPNLKTIQRQKKLPVATNTTAELLEAASSLVAASWSYTSPIRLLSVAATGLREESAIQMQLIDDPTEQRTKSAKLDSAIDSIRSKYGKNIIGYGNTLKTDIVFRHTGDNEERE